ncbi:far upstream element-binding protein 1 isoform X2 [Stomoxys calcitrans]|uniref:far upstream element-binding protein 1 isoform X2 n=1 Tax=Stomoxys calcitrans TaxID=35570 RepID=UPI0027E23313|nr:far upstream element-binding protein 1 isoform X2 [Stomoxys calcitrans]
MGDFGGSTAAHNNLNQSQAFAAALQRAKQIAAKIQPNAPPSGGGPGAGFKRSHDESDAGPEVKRFTSPDANDYGHNSNSNMSGGGSSSGGGPANMSQALAQAAAVAARLAATAGNTCEEQVRLPDSLMNAFYGRGSSDTITHIQGESGCKIQMGQQEGDRVITLRGSRESVTNGRELMQQLANRNGGGNVEVVLTINMPPPGPTGYPPYQEIMIPGTKVGLVIGKGGDTIKQLQEKTGAKMVIIQEGPNQELIKPLRISGEPQKIEMAKQLVLDLIAQKDAQNQQAAANNRPGMGGGGAGGMGANNGPNGGGNYNNFGAGGGESLEVFVPKIAVGVVIGKGGDMIRKIQQECGCKLQFIQGKHDEPGDRRCLIQGSRQQVDDAKRMIDGLIENVMQRNRNGSGGGGGGNSGAQSTDNGNSNYGYGYGVNHAQQPAREEISFMVPASKCGIVIGRGGETIKLINQQTGAYCEMDRNAVNPPSEKLFKCKGTPEQVEAARQMIAEKINMDLPIINRKSINGGPPTQQQQDGGAQGGYNAADPSAAAAAYQQQWAGYGQAGSWGEQAQPQAAGMGQAAAGGGASQADYSAQWIEYYKSMGMHREAEMIEQQLKAKQAASAPQGQNQQAAAPAAAAQTAGGQSQDYSAQWAEYYRSIGKTEEAEAIEKQMKNVQANAGSSIPGGSTGPNVAPGAPAAPSGGPAAAPGGGGGGYPQGMTPSQYAQYSQYYAAAAAAGGYPQPGGYGGPGAGGYGAPGGYPGAPQPPGSGPNQGGNNQKKNDKH